MATAIAFDESFSIIIPFASSPCTKIRSHHHHYRHLTSNTNSQYVAILLNHHAGIARYFLEKHPSETRVRCDDYPLNRDTPEIE